MRNLAAVARGFSTSFTKPRQLQIGDVLRQTRLFTKDDVERYADLTGDRNPAHLDDHFARQVANFDGGCVVHGMLVASLFPSIIAAHFPGAVYVSQTLKFTQPVYINDELFAEVQVTYLRENKSRYIAKFATKCFVTKESRAIDGEAMAILPTLTLGN